jgi:hypothetical protein
MADQWLVMNMDTIKIANQQQQLALLVKVRLV